jgi:hypothetical protein
MAAIVFGRCHLDLDSTFAVVALAYLSDLAAKRKTELGNDGSGRF